MGVVERSGEIFLKRSSLTGYLYELSRAKDAFDEALKSPPQQDSSAPTLRYEAIDANPNTPLPTRARLFATEQSPVATLMGDEYVPPDPSTSQMIESRDVRQVHSDFRVVFALLNKTVEEERVDTNKRSATSSSKR